MKIETDKQYRDALAELDKLMPLDPEKESPEGIRLNMLADAIVAWEREHYAFRGSDDRP